jgi:hypothetical protein
MRSGAVRLLIVVLSLAAWFSLSNHCAIGRVASSTGSVAESESAGCPMHSDPAKKKPATKTPCCKDLRAIVAKSLAAHPVALRVTGSREYAPEVFAPPLRAALEIDGVDTGPPDCFSFAESVLQESMLSHAPPVS